MEYEPWHIEPSGAVNGRQQPLPEGGWVSDDTGSRYTNTGAPYNPNTWQPQMAPPSPSMFSPLGSSGTGQSASTGAPTGSVSDQSSTAPTESAIPVPTINTGSVPTTYQFPTSTPSQSTTTSTTTQNTLLLYANAGIGSSTTSGTGTDSASSSPAILNLDLFGDAYTGTSVNLLETVPDITIASTSVAINQVHVTNTFSDDRGISGTLSASSTAQNKALIVSLLTTLRDLLVSFLQVLKSGQSYGFSAPWQPVQTYR
jgi:hypothetical protein